MAALGLRLDEAILFAILLRNHVRESGQNCDSDRRGFGVNVSLCYLPHKTQQREKTSPWRVPFRKANTTTQHTRRRLGYGKKGQEMNKLNRTPHTFARVHRFFRTGLNPPISPPTTPRLVLTLTANCTDGAHKKVMHPEVDPYRRVAAAAVRKRWRYYRTMFEPEHGGARSVGERETRTRLARARPSTLSPDRLADRPSTAAAR